MLLHQTVMLMRDGELRLHGWFNHSQGCAFFFLNL